MANLLIPNTGAGAEIREYLERELSIPPNARRFSVTLEVGQPIVVSCDYYAAPRAEDDDLPAPQGHGGLNG